MGLATGLPALHQQEGKAMPGLLLPMVPGTQLGTAGPALIHYRGLRG